MAREQLHVTHVAPRAVPVAVAPLILRATQSLCILEILFYGPRSHRSSPIARRLGRERFGNPLDSRNCNQVLPFFNTVPNLTL